MPIVTDLEKLLRSGVHRMGELAFQTNVSNHQFVICHWRDVERMGEAASGSLEGGGLEWQVGPGAARELSICTADGHYRFAKGQPDMRCGWILALRNVEELRQALDQFYPAGLGMFLAWQTGTLEVENLRAKLERQTGMYRSVRTISDAGAQRLVREVCGPAHHCAKRILWQIDANRPLQDSAASRYSGIAEGVAQSEAIPLLCREACNHFVGECRRVAKEEARSA